MTMTGARGHWLPSKELDGRVLQLAGNFCGGGYASNEGGVVGVHLLVWRSMTDRDLKMTASVELRLRWGLVIDLVDRHEAPSAFGERQILQEAGHCKTQVALVVADVAHLTRLAGETPRRRVGLFRLSRCCAGM